jgi:hypothetical protein
VGGGGGGAVPVVGGSVAGGTEGAGKEATVVVDSVAVSGVSLASVVFVTAGAVVVVVVVVSDLVGRVTVTSGTGRVGEVEVTVSSTTAVVEVERCRSNASAWARGSHVPPRQIDASTCSSRNSVARPPASRATALDPS